MLDHKQESKQGNMRHFLISIFVIIDFHKSFVFTSGGLRHREDNSCKTPDEQLGECIIISDCRPLLELLTKNRNDLKVRHFLQRSNCGFEGTLPKVCCKLPEPEEDRVDSDEDQYRPNVACGITNVSTNRIVGGRPSELRAWPWMAILGYGQPVSWRCGGALINERYVVTAAHCLAKPVLVVRLGELDLNSTEDGANAIDVPVDHAFTHEDYDRIKYTSDIGLVRLRQSVRFNRDIQPICIPNTEVWRTKNFDGFNPYIAGWGALSFRGSSTSRLMEAQVEIRSTEDCKAAYENLPNQKPIIDDRVVCAGGGKRDSCQGDSGGPMMMPERGVFYLFGVVSYGYKCAEIGYPGVYTKVSHFADWILEKAV